MEKLLDIAIICLIVIIYQRKFNVVVNIDFINE